MTSSRKQSALLVIRILSDMTAVMLAWIFAYYTRFYAGFAAPKGIPETILYFKLLPFIAVIWFFVFGASGFYRRTGKHRTPFLEALDILQSCILATLAFIAFSYFYEEYRYSRIVLLIFAVIHPALIMTGRSLIRKAVRFYRRKSPPKDILAIGSGESLIHALSFRTERDDFATSRVAGAILVGEEHTVSDNNKLCRDKGLPVYQVPNDWPTFFAEHHYHAVIMALPYSHYGFLEQHLDAIANQVPDVKLLPDIMRYTKFAAGIEIIDNLPIITIHESPLAGMGSIIKRLIDLLGAVVAFILFGPIMAIIALLIRFSSKGPVFYRQERMGLDGRTFTIYKFRSMPIDAESKTGAVWAKPGDQRAYPLGSILRRTSLDELPQFFNVLRGDMSLVGPRPERPVFVNQFRRQIPGYMLRHKVKAGLTGWAQVNGWRGNTSIEKRIECDLFYIQNWSLWLDIRIIMLTVVKGFFHRNAY